MEPHLPAQLTQRKNDNQLTEADMLRLCLLDDEDLNFLGNLLYSEKQLLNEKKENQKIKKEATKSMTKKNITPFHIPNASIKNIHPKHQSLKTSIEDDI